jgi:hypothetical protein
MRLTRNVAAIALAFFDFRFCLLSAIGRERSAYVHFFFELPRFVASDVTLVSRARFDDFPSTSLACCHCLLPFKSFRLEPGHWMEESSGAEKGTSRPDRPGRVCLNA